MYDLELDIVTVPSFEEFLIESLPDDNCDDLVKIAKLIKRKHKISSIYEIEDMETLDRILLSIPTSLMTMERVGAIREAITKERDLG